MSRIGELERFSSKVDALDGVISGIVVRFPDEYFETQVDGSPRRKHERSFLFSSVWEKTERVLGTEVTDTKMTPRMLQNLENQIP